MSLSDEERKRIEEEERVRAEARVHAEREIRARVEKEKKAKERQEALGCLGVALGLIILLILIAFDIRRDIRREQSGALGCCQYFDSEGKPDHCANARGGQCNSENGATEFHEPPSACQGNLCQFPGSTVPALAAAPSSPRVQKKERLYGNLEQVLSEGMRGRLTMWNDPTDSVVLAVDEPTLEEESRSLEIRDRLGWEQLLRSGRLFDVAGGTRVLVLENHGFVFFSVKVRVLEGPHEGEVGWVYQNWVRLR